VVFRVAGTVSDQDNRLPNEVQLVIRIVLDSDQVGQMPKLTCVVIRMTFIAFSSIWANARSTQVVLKLVFIAF
jgi:hypothetical protein